MRIVLPLLLSMLIGHLPAMAAQDPVAPRIEADVDVQPVLPVGDEEQRAIYLAAGRVLKHVDQARSALTDEESDNAMHHVRQAILLTDIIREALPVYDVSARIRAGDLLYEDREQVQDTVVSVFDELERAAILSPVKDVQSQHYGDAGAEGTAVTDVELIHTRAELDVEVARDHLDAALGALENGRLDAANDSLEAIQASVRLSRVEIDLPLELARSNLMLARDRLDEGRHEDAQFALRVAMDALADYRDTVQESRKAEVTAIYGEMSRLERTLSSDARQAREKLDAWWDTLSQWSQQSPAGDRS